MAANSRTACAVQILCVMAYRGEGMTSALVSNSLQTNPVVVRRLLKSLELAGLVKLRPGKDGGVSFARSPAEITLDQVHAAVEGGGLFALREDGNPKCRVYRSMPALLGPIFASADQAVTDVLSRTTIASLTDTVRQTKQS